MSEIEDIFAKSSGKKPPTPEHKGVKRSFSETVVDTSNNSGKKKRKPNEPKKKRKPNEPRKPKKTVVKETNFEDSRGSGDRRKTEEGWPVYKENELGLNGEGGDTPLCPFDCNCCF